MVDISLIVGRSALLECREHNLSILAGLTMLLQSSLGQVVINTLGLEMVNHKKSMDPYRGVHTNTFG